MTKIRVQIGFVAVTVKNRHTDARAELISPTVYVTQRLADERADRYVARTSRAEVAIGVPCFVEVPDDG